MMLVRTFGLGLVVTVFFTHVGLSESGPSLTSSKSKIIGKSYFKDEPVMVLVMDETSQQKFQVLVEKFEKEHPMESGEVNPEQEGKDLDFIKGLIIVDARSHLLEKFAQESEKINKKSLREVGLLKKPLRLVGNGIRAGARVLFGEKEALKALSKAPGLANEMLNLEVDPYMKPYISEGRYQAVPLFVSKGDHCVGRGNGRMNLSYCNSGPSQNFLSTFAPKFEQGKMYAAVHEKGGKIKKSWVGDEVNIMDLFATYTSVMSKEELKKLNQGSEEAMPRWQGRN